MVSKLSKQAVGSTHRICTMKQHRSGHARHRRSAHAVQAASPFILFKFHHGHLASLAIDSFVPAIAGCRLQYVDSIDAYQQATMDKLQESCSRTQKAL